MLALEQTYLTRENKIDQYGGLGCGDFKGLTRYFSFLLKKTKWGSARRVPQRGPARGGGGSLGLIFAGYVPLAS